MQPKCRICHVVAEIDAQGRCHSCADAYMATVRKTTYGKYMAQKAADSLTEEIEIPISPDCKICKGCGKPFWPSAGKRQLYCSFDCAENAAKARAKLRSARNRAARKAAENGK